MSERDVAPRISTQVFCLCDAIVTTALCVALLSVTFNLEADDPDKRRGLFPPCGAFGRGLDERVGERGERHEWDEVDDVMKPISDWPMDENCANGSGGNVAE